MASTSGLFLALEPQVFVSKIRGRVFRTWKAAEDYYANSLREAKFGLVGQKQPEPEIEDAEELKMPVPEHANQQCLSSLPPNRNKLLTDAGVAMFDARTRSGGGNGTAHPPIQSNQTRREHVGVVGSQRSCR
jgi:hypothetical protein